MTEFMAEANEEIQNKRQSIKNQDTREPGYKA